jgi:hypothetical protein
MGWVMVGLVISRRLIPVLVCTYYCVGQTRNGTYLVNQDQSATDINAMSAASVDGPERLRYLIYALGPCVGLGERKMDLVGLRGLVDGPGVRMPASINMPERR